MFLANPALLHDSLAHQLSLTYHAYYAGISHSTASYVFLAPKIGTIGLAIQWLGYGNIDGYDPTGAPTGTFTANDFVLSLVHTHKVGVFSLGLALKYVQSIYANYTANGFAMDIGGTFKHPERI